MGAKQGAQDLVIVAVSGGVDSAVAAWLLREAGHPVQCLHMTNWEDDDHCEAAAEYRDARQVCQQLGLPLHRANFAREYRDRVFSRFLADLERGRTPNPDVLCNREIKFGVLRRYAQRLGGRYLATGHYCRVAVRDGETVLLKGRDPGKDQSYFLNAVAATDLADVMFPLGDLTKTEVRNLAAQARLPIADKPDSTGICFIGERRFPEFLSRYLAATPGLIRSLDGRVLGQHRGLPCYTLGQRQGLGIGGCRDAAAAPWYVAAKDLDRNELVVVQGPEHPALLRVEVQIEALHWIGRPPESWQHSGQLRCHAKSRYRQADQACRIERMDETSARVRFDTPQRAVTPGQYLVLYAGDRCLGGGVISAAGINADALRAAC